MRTVYAIQIEIEPLAGRSIEDTYSDLISDIWQWIKAKYLRTWCTKLSETVELVEQHPLDGHKITCLEKSANLSKLFILDWHHPHEIDSSISWIAQCALALYNGSIQISVVLRISADRIIIRPVRFELGRPRIVTNILSRYKSSIDGWQIPTGTDRISSSNLQIYVDNVLRNPLRNLPVIMVSPDSWNGGYVVSNDVLFERIKGFAHVALLSDKWAAFKLTDALDKSLSCYDGAIRIYWPGFKVEDNPYQHNLFLSSTIRSSIEKGLPFQDYLFKTLAAVASFRYTEGSIIRSTRQAILDLERQKVEELREKIQAGDIEKDKLETQLLETLETNDQLTEQIKNLNEELVAQKSQWAEVSQAMAVEQKQKEESQATSKKPIEKVIDAFKKAKEDFTGPLVFLDSAAKSAQESVYKNPDRVYQAFEALHKVASEWKEKRGKIGRDFKQILQDDYGFEVHQVSTTSGSKHREEYTFQYKGCPLLFSDHITIGAKQPDKCCSIHWVRDDEKLVLAIGYCGKHLPNTKT